jgi:hypothetical protein
MLTILPHINFMFSSLAKHGVWQNQSDLGHQYDDNDAGQHGKPERPDSSIYGVQRALSH